MIISKSLDSTENQDRFYKAEFVFLKKLKKYYQGLNQIKFFKKQTSNFSTGKIKELKNQILRSLNAFNKFIKKNKIGNLDHEIIYIKKNKYLIRELSYFEEKIDPKIEKFKNFYIKNNKKSQFFLFFYSKNKLVKKLSILKYQKFVKNDYNKNLNIKNAFQGYLFISPSVLLICIFMLFSIFMGILMSFYKVKVTGTGLIYSFVGLKQYSFVVNSPSFIESLKVTLWYMLMVAPAQTVISLVLSSVLSQKIKARKMFIVLYFLPTLTSSTALTLIFLMLFGSNGPMATILGDNFVTRHVLGLVAMMNIWTSIPYFLTIYNASHADIPKSQYEAASIDGASGFRKFLKITVPYLKPVTLFVLVMSIISTLQVFDQLYIIAEADQNIDPDKITSTAGWIYKRAFLSFGEGQDFGSAAAGSMVLTAIIFVFSIVANFLSKGRY